MGVLPQAAVVVALATLTGVGLVVRPMAGFLGAWFFITLAPASSVLPIVTEVGAERRMYLPLAALAVLAAIGAWRLLETLGRRAMVPGAVVALCLVVGALAHATVVRNRDYASGVALLQTTVDRWPHGRAHFNLATVLKEEGRIDEAMAHLRAAVTDDAQAQYVLGSELYDRGQFDDGIKELRAFIGRVGRTPSSTYQAVAARNLIALSLAQQGKAAEAVEEFQAALAIDPGNPDLHGNLAFVSLQRRDFESARRHYEAHLTGQDGSAFVFTNLGIALQELGDLEQAQERFRQALAIDPNQVEARTRLDRLSRAGAR
jgi:tetratricopeptide (TPR) repeat protein